MNLLFGWYLTCAIEWDYTLHNGFKTPLKALSSFFSYWEHYRDEPDSVVFNPFCLQKQWVGNCTLHGCLQAAFNHVTGPRRSGRNMSLYAFSEPKIIFNVLIKGRFMQKRMCFFLWKAVFLFCLVKWREISGVFLKVCVCVWGGSITEDLQRG